MAVNIIKRTWHQNQMVKIEPLNGFAFQAESGGHTFQIAGVDDSGNVVPISGTIAGVFLRPDNTDVALTGSASGGVASVTLTAECYAVPGRFLLTVYATSGSNKGTIYAAMGTVSRTSSGAVSPAAASDVVDLVNRINAATATIPASYTTLLNAVATDYSPDATYPKVGTFVWYSGKLYRSKVPITTAETWTAAHWNQVVLSDALNQDITDLKSALVQVAFFDGYIEDFGFRNIIRSNDDNTMEYANSKRLSSNLFNYINPKITLSLTGTGWLATLLVYKNKTLVYGSGWRTEYTYKVTDGDSFAVLLAKQVDSAYADITPADVSDSGLSVYVELGYIPVAKKSELDALETEVKADVDECEAKVENAENVLAYSGNITNFGFRNIIRANDNNRNEYINTARVSTLIYFYNAPNVAVSVTGEGWKFSLSFFKNHSLVFNSGWRTEYTYKAEEADSFTLTLAKQVDGAYVDIAPADANSAGLSINVIHGYVYPVSLNDYTASEKETEALQGLSKYIYNTKFYGHLFIDKINDGSEVIIPCQSKWDINITARMGYKIMEGNVHKTATSDKYIVMHGSAGTIGYQLFDPNGTDISGVVIANTPFETLRGYKYRSKYEKYQTPVTELTEFLTGCKENNMIPFVSFVDETELQIIRRYCGNNFVLYNGNRAVFGGMLTFWPTNSITIDAAKASMSYYGAPLLYGLPPVFFNNLTDAQLDDLVQYAHDRGILLGVQANHLTVQQTIRAFRHGIDASPASYQVNAFSGGNVAHISGDYTFDGITHTGSVADGKLTLQNLQGIVKEIDPIFVGKAFLRINFIGSLYIQFGRYDGAIPLESDGEQDVQMGSIIIDSSPTLRITSNETTVINSITYDVSSV